MMTSPYRVCESELMMQERVLEMELASAREMLDAYSNEEVRIGRKVLVGEASRLELADITATVERLIGTVDQLAYRLASVRREIHWRGERRLASPDRDGEQAPIWPLLIGAVLFAGVAAVGVLVPYLGG